MNLRPATPPPDSVLSARLGVSDLLAIEGETRGQRQSLTVTAHEPDLELTVPHEVFILGLEALSEGRGLAGARSVGWRYLVADGDRIVGAAETTARGFGDGHEFASFSRDPINTEMAEAISALESRPTADDSEHELRLLRVPAAFSVNLWLHGSAEDYLVPVAPSPPNLEPAVLYQPDELLNILRRDVGNQPRDELSGG